MPNQSKKIKSQDLSTTQDFDEYAGYTDAQPTTGDATDDEPTDELDLQEDEPTDELDLQDDEMSDAADDDELATDTAQTSDEIVISLQGDEEELAQQQSKETRVLRELRERNRQLTKELNKIKSSASTKQVDEPLLQEPVEPDFAELGFDVEEYKVQMHAYYKQKQAYDLAQTKANAEKQRQEAELNNLIKNYGKERVEFMNSAKDFEDSENEVVEKLSIAQQNVLLSASDKPALLVYALGKKPELLKQLQAIQNPARFAAEIVKIEGKIKMTGKTNKPQPEKRLGLGSGVTGQRATHVNTASGTLERLRAEADKTGDFTKLMEFKRKLKQQNNK